MKFMFQLLVATYIFIRDQIMTFKKFVLQDIVCLYLNCESSPCRTGRNEDILIFGTLLCGSCNSINAVFLLPSFGLMVV